MEPLFTIEHGRYFPTEWARGPWNPLQLHGGPPAALLAHGLQSEQNDAGLWPARISIDLLRPVPLAPLEVNTRVVREGKRMKLVDAFLHHDDVVVARASAVMLRRTSELAGSPASESGPRLPSWTGLSANSVGKVGNEQRIDADARLFHRGTEFRAIQGSGSIHPYAVWIHLPYLLLPDHPLTPFERAAATADYVNAAGTLAHPQRRGFINADITLYLHREPEGDWLCLETVGRPDLAGIATSTVNVHDAAGLLGSAASACLANAIPRTFGAEIGISDTSA